MQARYSAVNQTFHWLTAILMFAILPIAWIMTSLGRDAPGREAWVTTHKTIGISILAITLCRMLWRIVDPPPPLPGAIGRWERVAAKTSYALLYVVLVGMPVSGYILSAAGGHPVELFGLFPIPPLVPHDETLGRSAATAHILGRWLVYALIVLHLLGVAFHVVLARDGLLGRMLPASALEPPP
jgi:cytochrome b561